MCAIRNTGKSRVAELATVELHSLISTIIMCCPSSNESLPMKFEEWISDFHDGIKHVIPIPMTDISFATKEPMEDVSYFQEILVQKLKLVQEKLDASYEAIHEDTFSNDFSRVYKRIGNLCLGCKQQCPFCKAPCTLSSDRHENNKNHSNHFGCSCMHCVEKIWIIANFIEKIVSTK